MNSGEFTVLTNYGKFIEVISMCRNSNFLKFIDKLTLLIFVAVSFRITLVTKI